MQIIVKVIQTIIASLLSIIVLGVINYYLEQQPKSIIEDALSISQYSIKRSSYWKNRFNNFNNKKFKLKEMKWILEGQQLIIYDGEIQLKIIYNEIFSSQIIISISQIYPGYYLVNYGDFQQVLNFRKSQGSICLVSQIDDKSLRYYVDFNNNLWIISSPMNKIILMQQYSCSQQRVLKVIKYKLDSFRYINQIGSINCKGNVLQIQVLTYEAHSITISVNLQNYAIKQESKQLSHTLKYQPRIIQSGQIEVYGLNRLPKGLIQYLYNQIIIIINELFVYGEIQNIDTFPLDEQLKIQVSDRINNCFLQLNKQNSYLYSLDKYLIQTKNGIFSQQKYNPYDIIDVLNNIKQKTIKNYKYFIKNTRKIQIEKYKGLYQLYPNTQMIFIGIKDQSLDFYPTQNLNQQQYYMIRTQKGALILKGREIKGHFQNKQNNNSTLQIYQQITQKAQQVYRNIYEIHIAYRNLFTLPIRNRIQLIIGTSGKIVLTHYSQLNYQVYYNSLINNQWWIFQYNSKTNLSIAIKYQLFVNATNVKQTLYLKRIYGNIMDQNDSNQLNLIMKQFINEKNQGYKFINIFKCIDEFYYIQFCNSKQQHYGIARIHYKKMSNRRPKINGKYVGQFQKNMIMKQLAIETLMKDTSHQTYAVLLPNYLVKGEHFNQLPKHRQYWAYPYSIYSRVNSNQQIITVMNLRNIVNQGLIGINKKKTINPTLSLLTLIPIFLILYFIILRILSNQKSKYNQKPKQNQKPKSDEIQLNNKKKNKKLKKKQ